MYSATSEPLIFVQSVWIEMFNSDWFKSIFTSLNVVIIFELPVTDLVVPDNVPRGFEIGLPGSALHLENKEQHYLIK